MRDDPIPRFVRISSGEFVMGSDEGADDERPSHRVHVDAFYASIHPITVEQYGEFAKEAGYGVPAIRDLPLVVTPAQEPSFRELATPYVWRGGEMPRERARHPVTLVTHADATAYCRWLSGRVGRLVRLPTDAYRNGENRNPRGPSSGSLRVVRGGSWVTHDVDQLRCAHRHKVPPDTYAYSIGFRVVYSDDGTS